MSATTCRPPVSAYVVGDGLALTDGLVVDGLVVDGLVLIDGLPVVDGIGEGNGGAELGSGLVGTDETAGSEDGIAETDAGAVESS